MAFALLAKVAPLIADDLEQHRMAILRHYRSDLTAGHDAAPADSVSARDHYFEAGRVLSDVIRTLRLRELRGRTGGSGEPEPWAASTARPHLSVRVSETLFDVILGAVQDTIRDLALRDDDTAAAIVRLTAQAIHHSLDLRVQRNGDRDSSWLPDRVHEALREERRSIARELHDRVGQSAAAAKRMLELHQLEDARHQPGGDGTTLVAVQGQLDRIMDELRMLTGELRAAAELESVETAMRQYLDAVRIADDQAVSLVVNGVEAWAAPGIRDELFLIVREATCNALTHAGFRRLSIQIDIAPHEATAVISDDGVGLPAQPPAGVHTGLVSMREHAELLGGTLAIHSRPEHGTTVEVAIPLHGLGHVRE
jgi:signal transduction histidine kinase